MSVNTGMDRMGRIKWGSSHCQTLECSLNKKLDHCSIIWKQVANILARV